MHRRQDGGEKTQWREVPLRAVATVGAGDLAPQLPKYFVDGRFPFVRTSDVGLVHRSPSFLSSRDLINEAAVRDGRMRQWRAGTILVPKSGASTSLNHRVRLAQPAYVSSHLATVNARRGTDERFLYYVLCHVDARELFDSIDYPSLRLDRLRSAVVSIPPMESQRRIADYLDKVTADLDSAVASVLREVALLREYQPALISDVVTGKVDVREAAERLPGRGGKDS